MPKISGVHVRKHMLKPHADLKLNSNNTPLPQMLKLIVLLQIVSEAVKKGASALDGMSLVEVGPRVCLQPIKIFAGSFGGPVLYENPAYVSPNKVQSRLSLATACYCVGFCQGLLSVNTIRRIWGIFAVQISRVNMMLSV